MMLLSDRAKRCTHPVAQRLLELMEHKQTNLCVAADLTSSHALVQLAEAIGPEICLLKTHIDILEDFTPDVTCQLTSIARKHQFLLFEDRKFADIGNTVAMQYAKGIYHIADWADLVNAHIFPGPGIIEGLKKEGMPKNRALLLLAEMSSQGSLAQGQEALKMAEAHPDFVIGFISLGSLNGDPRWLYFTPGVQLEEGRDPLGQQFRSVQSVIAAGSDIIIVGRAIYNSPTPRHTAHTYRETAWSAYTKREKKE